MPVISLLTDFGLSDHFVAAMKGVMLSVNPELAFVDISHLVPPQDVFTGAFILGQSCFCFPAGSIHLAVVDPGVGTDRKAMVASAGGHLFVAPDNGLLTYVLDKEDGIAFEITAERYFHKPVSSTFHGRDIFAPIAAWLSRGIPLHQLGSVLPNPVKLSIPALMRVRDSVIQGAILAVDHFGNLITNLTFGDLPRSFKIQAGQKEVTNLRRTYGEAAPGEVFLILGSTGYLEIALKNGSAASALNLSPGAAIDVVSL